ncbi:hypothetical protein [Arthrobacter sp. H14-L1]|uniref:hypothetical protein n=1 Tax=Arthrobacter sp. H14-L1 TaxID=2996697 RepID=UPI00226F8FC8|nr:hypothetical protein [Arthrobacter sp. H14-L1]MCY0906030.1 hypothetical protein [Arthrobacter sp. H14-L1]
MTIQTQGTSARMVYQWDDTINGSQQRAVALQSSCETDLTRLEDLFDEYHGFDSTNRATIVVGDPGGGLASNFGYHSDGSTLITVTAWSGVNPAATADTGVRLEFVAEMCEILMGLRNARKGSSWDPGGSNGEGLSQYLAELFYPGGYYDSQLGHGPSRMTAWLNDPTRPDWVTKTDPEDKQAGRYGCAFLFLHFLHSQKGFSVKDIITKGGITLEDTYRNLMGSPGGWNEFSALLNRFFPLFFPATGPGQTQIQYSPERCNLFPLYDNYRRTSPIGTEEIAGYPTSTPGGAVVITPGLLCTKAEYSWNWLDPNSSLACTVRPTGFGNPVVSWVIDGTAVGGAGSLNVTGPVDLDRADHPGQPDRSVQAMTFSAVVSDVSDYTGAALRLTLKTADHLGTEQLTVETNIAEQYAPDIPPLGSVSWTTLHTHGVRYEPRYYADRDACRKRWDEFIDKYVRVRDINILLTLPDPGPDGLRRAAYAIQELQRELRRLQGEDPEMAARLGAELAGILNVSPATLQLANLTDLTDLTDGN